MSREDRPREAPAGAAGDSIILHVPACVQRFSSQRRVLSRLRALARRRSRGLPELDGPVKLQVEENPNWPPEERVGMELVPEFQDWSEGSDPLSPEAEAPPAETASLASEAAAAAQPAEGVAEEQPEDPSAVILHQLEEDNRDLKAALCRLIRIAEENHTALRLLEEENEDLAAQIRRLTMSATADAGHPTPAARQPRLRGWNSVWLKQRLERRCS